MKYKSKNDYLKAGKRSDVHTSIRSDIYENLQVTAIKLKEPSTKCLDVIIEMILNDKNLFDEFKNKLRLY